MRTSRARTLKSPWNHRRSPRLTFQYWKQVKDDLPIFARFLWVPRYVRPATVWCVYIWDNQIAGKAKKNKSPLSDCNPTRIDWGFKRFFSRRMRQVNITCQLTRCGRTMVMWDVSCVLSLSPCFLSLNQYGSPPEVGKMVFLFHSVQHDFLETS